MDRRKWNEPVDQKIVAEGVFLGQRELLRITRGDRLLVGVHAGTLWITQEGDAGDFVIQAGQCHRLEGDGMASGVALAQTSLTISAALDGPERWKIERVSPHGAKTQLSGRSRGNRILRALTAGWLRLYRTGARAALRAAESARQAEAVRDVARLAAQLDARTRKDIGLERYGASLAERAERFRWLHNLHGTSRHSTFL